MLVALLPDEPEPHGLLALMLCHDARRAARFAHGELVLLADQDRSLWDDARLTEGRDVAGPGDRAARTRRVRPAGRDRVPAGRARIDWAEVAVLYGELARVTGSPVVELNRAVAIAEAGAPEEALELVERLDLDGYRYLHSTRAELLRRLGRAEEARAAYRRALELTESEPERRFLRSRLDASSPCRA